MNVILATAKRRPWLEFAALGMLTLLLWVVPALVSQGQYDPVLAGPKDPSLPAADRSALVEGHALALAAPPRTETAALR